MTTIYFIRHAESDNRVSDNETRPLTEKGLIDRLAITAYLDGKNITKILSSPYKRAVDTLSDFAEKNGLDIETVYDFRERKSDSDWMSDPDFWAFIERQWNDFNHKLDGESLNEVQTRNIFALIDVLKRYSGQNLVIGTHGTALSAIINFYDKSYGFPDFMVMVHRMPWIVKMEFEGDICRSIEKIDIFEKN